MVIESGSINNILRTYSKQLKYGKLSSAVDSPTSSKDKLSLSPEAKKMMLLSSIISESEKNVNPDDIKSKLDQIDFSKISEEEIPKLKEELLKAL